MCGWGPILTDFTLTSLGHKSNLFVLFGATPDIHSETVRFPSDERKLVTFIFWASGLTHLKFNTHPAHSCKHSYSTDSIFYLDGRANSTSNCFEK